MSELREDRQDRQASKSGPVRFALLMPWGRVGSNVICAGLGAIDRVEIANEPTTALRTQGHAAGLPLETVCEQQFDHLAEFFGKTTESLAGAGLKLSYRSLVDGRAYLERLQDMDARLVVLVRENFLKCAVSQLRALERAAARRDNANVWNSPWAVRTGEPKPGPSIIDIDETIRLTGVFRSFHERMLKDVEAVFPNRYFRVEYDRLRRAPDQTMRDVMVFLGLQAPQDIPVRHRKATSDTLRDDILNFEAFEAAVISAGLGGFL